MKTKELKKFLVDTIMILFPDFWMKDNKNTILFSLIEENKSKKESEKQCFYILLVRMENGAVCILYGQSKERFFSKIPKLNLFITLDRANTENITVYDLLENLIDEKFEAENFRWLQRFMYYNVVFDNIEHREFYRIHNIRFEIKDYLSQSFRLKKEVNEKKYKK